MSYTEEQYDLFDESNGTTNRSDILPRSKLGLTSACKVLKKTSTCEAIKDVATVIGSSRTFFKNIFFLSKNCDSKLSTFVNATLQQSLESLFSGLKGPRIAVQQWASKNMPALYGYFGSLTNYVQAQIFRLSDENSPTKFYKRVAAACTLYNEKFADKECDYDKIGDGECNSECNNPYCLNDGGDCLRGIELYTSSHAYWDENDDEFKYRGFSPLQQGDEILLNPYYNISNATTYDTNVTKELKELSIFNTDAKWNEFTESEKNLEKLSIWQSLPTFSPVLR